MCISLRRAWFASPQNPNAPFENKCRTCAECRQIRAREWSLRCGFEGYEHEASCFVTLTYTDENNPIFLIKDHLQKFKKDLRRQIEYHYSKDIKIKTFDCGEYGDQTFRPHFHLIIFGFDFPDKYLHGESKRGHKVYNSEFLDRVWNQGHATIQDATKDAAAYCALYAAKERHELPHHLQPYPEFNTMSLSLGVEPILQKIDTHLQTDEIWFDGKKYSIPQIILDKKFPRIVVYRMSPFEYQEHKYHHPFFKLYQATSLTVRAHQTQYDKIKQDRIDKMTANEKAEYIKKGLTIKEIREQQKHRVEARKKRLQNPL